MNGVGRIVGITRWRTRWQGVALVVALFLVLFVLLMVSGSAQTLPVSPDSRTLETVHDSPGLTAYYPPPGREWRFRRAVFTLFLDEAIAPLAADAGFDTVVQVFPWRDLNPSADLYTWEASDYMVRIARTHGLELVVRLDMPPEWAIVPHRHSGLPFDLVAYADFVAAVVERYQGHVLGYIIWNEPNLAAEWSRSGGDSSQHWESFDGWVAAPVDYVGVLCEAYNVIHAADPDALVVAAGLAPTNEVSPRALDDRLFLRQIYAAGAANCFDVLSVHDYGYGLSPEDERGAHGGLNLARILDLRDIMVAHGDHKPVWITELGYTVQPGLHPSVSEEEQAAYLVGSFERVQRDWPWVEMLTVWNLCYGLPPDNEMSGYSLVEPDLTPRMAYWALRETWKRNE